MLSQDNPSPSPRRSPSPRPDVTVQMEAPAPSPASAVPAASPAPVNSTIAPVNITVEGIGESAADYTAYVEPSNSTASNNSSASEGVTPPGGMPLPNTHSRTHSDWYTYSTYEICARTGSDSRQYYWQLTCAGWRRFLRWQLVHPERRWNLSQTQCAVVCRQCTTEQQCLCQRHQGQRHWQAQ